MIAELGGMKRGFAKLKVLSDYSLAFKIWKKKKMCMLLFAISFKLEEQNNATGVNLLEFVTKSSSIPILDALLSL